MRYEEIYLDKARKLRFDFNAIADLEQKAGVGIGALLSEEKIGFNTLRLLLWAALKWEDRKLTSEQAGDLMQDFVENGGDLTYISVLITKALEKSGMLGKQGDEEKNVETEAATN